MRAADRDRWLLALDTATATVVVAAGSPDGHVLASEAVHGRFHHSGELLPAVRRSIDRAGLALADLGAVIVGTGPGAFTGLRVGIATAKTLAHELGRPLVAVPTAEALLAAVEGADLLWLPSGARDRIAVRVGQPPVVVPDPGPEGTDAEPGPRAGLAGVLEVAVDLDGRAPAEALVRGRVAVAGLAASLLRLGVARLAAGEADDPERLVPTYGSPPRGVAADAEGAVAWSHDRR